MANKVDYGRSIGALIGAYFVMNVILVIGSFILYKLFLPSLQVGVPPQFTTSYLVGMLFVNAGAALIGGYATAAIAGSHRLQHALVLAGIILLVQVVFLALPARLLPGREAFPLWYSLTSFVVTPLSLVLGGWWRSKKAA